jgi:hypothetical protein
LENAIASIRILPVAKTKNSVHPGWKFEEIDSSPELLFIQEIKNTILPPRSLLCAPTIIVPVGWDICYLSPLAPFQQDTDGSLGLFINWTDQRPVPMSDFLLIINASLNSDYVLMESLKINTTVCYNSM